ncbi:hypothetical protein RUA8715_02276 [Ruegeria arenilitoris]|uniref:Uncharacterized protein n=1 Tax=Ruegeria arenilitoris TaxID=1173585 RepID=A0A238KLR2_9RHOB|nr:hypothetical protein RUA8715_02276 [Ruegeria arenilitoris]
MLSNLQTQFHRMHEVCVVLYVCNFVLEYAQKAYGI